MKRLKYHRSEELINGWTLETEKTGSIVWFNIYILKPDGFLQRGTFQKFAYRRDAVAAINKATKEG